MSNELSIEDLDALPVGQVVIDSAGDHWEKTERPDAPWLFLDKDYPREDPYFLSSSGLVYVWSPIALDFREDPEGKQLVQAILDRKETQK